MSVLKRRSRMISFRLSEDEYTGLKNLCVNEGARSVSDLARDALQRLLSGGAAPDSRLESSVQILKVRIEALDLEVKRLATVVHGRVQPGAVAAPANSDD